MSVISHSCICAGTVPLKQTESFGGRAGAPRVFFKSKGQIPQTPQSPACKVLCFTLQRLEPWAGFLPCSGRQGDVPRAVKTTTDRSTRVPAMS